MYRFVATHWIAFPQVHIYLAFEMPLASLYVRAVMQAYSLCIDRQAQSVVHTYLVNHISTKLPPNPIFTFCLPSIYVHKLLLF